MVPPQGTHIGLGELDRAIERLEEAFERREAHIVNMHVEPWYGPLWDDRRFQRLVARAGYDPRAAQDR